MRSAWPSAGSASVNRPTPRALRAASSSAARAPGAADGSASCAGTITAGPRRVIGVRPGCPPRTLTPSSPSCATSSSLSRENRVSPRKVVGKSSPPASPISSCSPRGESRSSSGWSGSSSPATPMPRTCQRSRSMLARTPNCRSASTRPAMASEAGARAIVLSPKAIAATLRARCDSRPSPGTRMLPRSHGARSTASGCGGEAVGGMGGPSSANRGFVPVARGRGIGPACKPGEIRRNPQSLVARIWR